MKNLPKNKTKLVCSIGPATDSPEMIEKMVEAGMNATSNRPLLMMELAESKQ